LYPWVSVVFNANLLTKQYFKLFSMNSLINVLYLKRSFVCYLLCSFLCFFISLLIWRFMLLAVELPKMDFCLLLWHDFSTILYQTQCEVTLQNSFSSHSHTRSTKRWRVDKHASLELKAPIFCIKIQTHHTSLILKWLRIPWYFISIFYGVYFTVANSFF